MIFRTLRFLAFGPFTNRQLELCGTGHGGLQILYGPNEAGKSSALRAIRQVLYGMDVQSRDAFLHPNASLRLGALLERQDGRTLEFVRRKANKNSLRQADDQSPLADDVLDEWLGGVDAAAFQSLFGIDQTRLRSGGAEMLKQGGHLGGTLFAAAAGVANLQAIQRDLNSGYEALYKSKGKNQRIAELLRQLETTRKQLRELQLPSETWRRAQEDFDKKQEERAKRVQQLSQSKQQEARLLRFQNAFPVLARWKLAKEQLAQEPAAPLLPDTFAGRFEQAHRDFEWQSQAVLKAHSDLEKLAAEFPSSPELEALLHEEETIQELQRLLGSDRKAQQDRPGLVVQRDAAEREAAQILRALGRGADLTEAEALRLSPDQKVRIQELGTQQKGLLQQLTTETDRAARARREWEMAQQRLSESIIPPDGKLLYATMERIRSQGDLEARLDQATAEIAATQATWQARLQRLAFWEGAYSELESLPIPSVETIQQFEQTAREREGVRQTETRRQKELLAENDRIQEELRLLDATGMIPTEADLLPLRAGRDGAWAALKTDWQTGKGFPVADALSYEEAVQQADRLADQLRREADRVAQKAALLVEEERTRARLAECDRNLELLTQQAADWATNWQALWSLLPKPAGNPAEMQRWLQEREALLLAGEKERLQQAKVGELQDLIARLRDEADAAVGQIQGKTVSSPSLQFAVAQAKSFWETVEEQQQTRSRLQQACDLAEREWQEAEAIVAKLTKDLQQWQDTWSQTVKPLGLKGDASPGEAFAVLQSIDELFRQLQIAADRNGRIAGIDEDARLFAAQVAAVYLRLIGTTATGHVADDVAELGQRSRVARKMADQQAALKKQEKAFQKQLTAAQTEKAKAETELDILCAQAGGIPLAELPETIQRAERRRQLTQEIRHLEDQLTPLTAGVDLASFVAESETLSVDALPAQLEELARKQALLEAELSQLDQAIGTARAELDRMRGQGDAADQAELYQSQLAELQDATRQYAVLRLAANVLQRGIERYRERHQGPLLSRASHLFARLTEGSFEGLRPDYNDKGEPLLVGIRPITQAVVEISGMSDGACDQLYLALRLAALEAWLDHHEPMPFVVDDILLNFDDNRAAAALEVLGELSRKTQILFLTHHQRLVELAQERLPADVYRIHKLSHA